jgi:hypothetical protein
MSQKSNKRLMAGTITGETKREGQKERPKDVQPARTKKKEGRELVLLVVGNYFTHNLSNVVCIQIVRFNNNERSRISITCQRNLPLYSKG